MLELEDDEIQLLSKITSRLAGISGKELGTPLYHFCSALMPSVNVDVILRDEQDRFLLSWRDDEFYGPGWHVPGGVIRHRESLASRLVNVLKRELDIESVDLTDYSANPAQVREVFHPDRCVRGHFLSILFDLTLSQVNPDLRQHEVVSKGKIEFFRSPPKNLIKEHTRLYGDYFAQNFAAE